MAVRSGVSSATAVDLPLAVALCASACNALQVGSQIAGWLLPASQLSRAFVDSLCSRPAQRSQLSCSCHVSSEKSRQVCLECRTPPASESLLAQPRSCLSAARERWPGSRADRSRLSWASRFPHSAVSSERGDGIGPCVSFLLRLACEAHSRVARMLITALAWRMGQWRFARVPAPPCLSTTLCARSTRQPAAHSSRVDRAFSFLHACAPLFARPVASSRSWVLPLPLPTTSTVVRPTVPPRSLARRLNLAASQCATMQPHATHLRSNQCDCSNERFLASISTVALGGAAQSSELRAAQRISRHHACVRALLTMCA